MATLRYRPVAQRVKRNAHFRYAIRNVLVDLPCPGRLRGSSYRAGSEITLLTSHLSAGIPDYLDRADLLPTFSFPLANAGAASESVAAAVTANILSASPTDQRAGGWVAPLADVLEQVLYVLKDCLDLLHVPYSYGYSIILLTLIVKIVTYPLTKQQVESTLAVQALKPRVDLIKDRFGDDKEKIQKETSILYEQAGVNPLAGCLPTLATTPIFIGLYSSLTNVANEGLLDTQGFYWIPSLAGPTTLAQRQSGLGTSWLFPLVDGAPAIGWDAAVAYLTLPVLLILVQYASLYSTGPTSDATDVNARLQRALLLGLPVMIGWFALNVPSGLSLYYLSNTILSTAQQVYLKKLGGAKVAIKKLGPIMKPGSGRRSGAPEAELKLWVSATTFKSTAERGKNSLNMEGPVELARNALDTDLPETTAALTDVIKSSQTDSSPLVDLSNVNRFCKRRRLSSLVQDGANGAQIFPAATTSV
uniref:ALB3_1f n=1 Tax=Volvox carteri f. nagariensis TaxID=3068 RepID=D9CIZ3_VOLCA|nr:ALB3_1f [Volvox carteri f. nagariensis]